jgi:hypothetical protein
MTNSPRNRRASDGHLVAESSSGMSQTYILDGHTPVAVDVLTWARWYGEARQSGAQRVAEETVGESRISTVFLGLDHRFGDGPPLLFETMVFGGPLDQEQTRCSTWEEAEHMHAVMRMRVKDAMQ